MQTEWIWLTLCRGLGARRIAKLLTQFVSAEELFFSDRTTLERAGVSPQEVEALLDKNLDEAKRIEDDCFDKGIEILTLSDAAYPACLRAIADPPPVLYLLGRLPKVDTQPSIGIVGTRKASLYGISTAKRLGYQLAACGGIVVTGLARGVDTAAAEGALLAAGQVIGVLGCGVDVVYPRENKSLYLDVRVDGCLLSEYPPGTKPHAGNFPLRNRILSGLCDGVLVIEAGERSGALITAAHALEQGRDVFAVPGLIDNPQSLGSNDLLRQGAGLVSAGYDLLREYENRYPGRITENRTEPAAPQPKPQTPAQPEKPKARPASSSAAQSPEEQTVLQALGTEKRQLDELIDASGLPAAKVLAALTMLQIRGAVTQLPGKWYAAT